MFIKPNSKLLKTQFLLFELYNFRSLYFLSLLFSILIEAHGQNNEDTQTMVLYWSLLLFIEMIAIAESILG